jgi:hypothetical protein
MAVSVPNVRRLLLCVTGALVLSACGDNSVQNDASGAVAPPPAVTSPAATAAPGAVPDTLAFSAPLVGGGTLNFADYAGTPLLLWFWAPT